MLSPHFWMFGSFLAAVKFPNTLGVSFPLCHRYHPDKALAQSEASEPKSAEAGKVGDFGQFMAYSSDILWIYMGI